MASTSTRTRPVTQATRRDCRLRSQNRRWPGGDGSRCGAVDADGGSAGGGDGAVVGCGTASTSLTARSSRARCLDDVARTPDGVDQLRLDVVDLLAQVADVELDDVRLALEVVLPHAVEDLRLRQDDPLVAHEVAKQLELGSS